MPTKQKSAVKKTVKYGNDFSGTLRIFSKEKSVVLKDKKKATITDFWFNFSREVGEKQWDNASLKVLFDKELETPESNTVITFKGFITMTGTGDYTRVAAFIKEWDYSDEE